MAELTNIGRSDEVELRRVQSFLWFGLYRRFLKQKAVSADRTKRFEGLQTEMSAEEKRVGNALIEEYVKAIGQLKSNPSLLVTGKLLDKVPKLLSSVKHAAVHASDE